LARPHCALILALGLILTPAASGVAAAAQAPKISKPRPAPNTPPQVPPLPMAVYDNTLAISGEEIKARKIDTRLSPYRFVVDSGADTSVVGLRIARDLQLPLGSPAILNGMTSRNLVDRVKVAQLTMGPSTVTNLEVPALREVDLGSDGLLGIDALTQQRLMMDFDRRLIKVEDARVPIKYDPRDIVITARRQRGQLILTQVQAAGLKLEAVIDTGSEVTIGNLALRDKLIRRHQKFETVPAIGVTGVTVNLQMALVDELQLGPVTLRDVPIAFADVPPFKLFGLDRGPALLLGTDILEAFRKVSLDFRARKVRFQLKRCKSDGLVISTSTISALTRLSATADACRD
jgi:hypothetical protein